MTQPAADVLLRIERLLRIGKQQEAQVLLVEYLKVNPFSARAWWLMSLTVPGINQQRDCLERVLRLDPDDELARERLEMLKNQPTLPPSVKPFTVLDLPEVNSELPEGPITPKSSAPFEVLPEKDKPVSVPEPAAIMPDWAASSVVAPDSSTRTNPTESDSAGSAGTQTGDVSSVSSDQVAIPELLRVNATDRVPIPRKSKRKWWVLDIFLALLAIGLLAFFALYILKQQQAQKKAEEIYIFQQQTVQVAQTLASMPLPTLFPTWTPSPTWTTMPTRKPSPTPTFTPTQGSTFATTVSPSRQVGPIVGQYAPDFDLTDQATGLKVKLSQYDGQPVLIFFFSTLCPKCNGEIDALENIFNTYKDTNLVLLGIDSTDSQATITAYRVAHPITFPILLDPGSKTLTTYRVNTLPGHFFVDNTGRVANIGMGVMTLDEIKTQIEMILERLPTSTP
jgi:peroxiredoxin